jgi:hypothetical protein
MTSIYLLLIHADFPCTLSTHDPFRARPSASGAAGSLALAAPRSHKPDGIGLRSRSTRACSCSTPALPSCHSLLARSRWSILMCGDAFPSTPPRIVHTLLALFSFGTTTFTTVLGSPSSILNGRQARSNYGRKSRLMPDHPSANGRY